MKVLHFKSAEEFENYFNKPTPKVAKYIVTAIQEAMMFNRKSADLFSITFENQEFAFDISLPQTEWVQALENVLQKYHGWQMYDDAIDTYELKKTLENW